MILSSNTSRGQGFGLSENDQAMLISKFRPVPGKAVSGFEKCWLGVATSFATASQVFGVPKITLLSPLCLFNWWFLFRAGN